MYNFNFYKAKDTKDAVDKLNASSDGKLLAGGQTLLAAMKLRLSAPSDLVSLEGIENLANIEISSKDLQVGAMTRHTEVAESKLVQDTIPSLSKLASGIGDRMVRNMGTIGGSIANNDPAADYPAAILGLGAKIKTNRREIQADEFFSGMYETVLEQDEIIENIHFPKPEISGYAKFKNPASRYAIVGVFVSKNGDDVRVAVTGAGPCVYRVAVLEEALSKEFSAKAIQHINLNSDGLTSDMHAKADYRAHLIGVMAQQAIASATA